MNSAALQNSDSNGSLPPPSPARGLPWLPRSVRGNVLALLAVLLVPLLALQGFISYRNFQDSRAQALESNLDIARATSVAFDAYVRDILDDELALGGALAASPPPDVNGYLKASADENPSLREFFWVDPTGTIVASSNTALIGVGVSDRDYYQAVTGGKPWMVSDLILARVGGEPVFVIARGARDGSGRLLGIMCATVLSEKLDAVLPIQRAGGAAIGIVDRAGWLVYRNPVIPLSWEQRGSTKAEPVVARALGGAEATGEYYSIIDEQNRLGATTPVRSLGWVARATQPAEEVSGPVLLSVLRDAGLFLLISLIAFSLAWGLSRRITRPLKSLEEHATLIAGGSPGVQAEATGPEEIRHLAGALNQMSREIAIRQDELTRMNQTLAERATELDAANKELEAFSYSVSHDLRAPLRTIDGFSKALLEDYSGVLDEDGQEYLRWVRTGTQKMGRLIDDMLTLSRVTRLEMRRERVDLSEVAKEIGDDLRHAQSEREVTFTVEPGVVAHGDARLLQQVMANLIGNAWKFTSRRDGARIEVGSALREGERIYFVRDNGVGFDPAYASKLFGAFQRLHSEEEFPGTGVGLATVQRIIHRHGGRIWAEAGVDQGATFYFTLDGASNG